MNKYRKQLKARTWSLYRLYNRQAIQDYLDKAFPWSTTPTVDNLVLNEQAKAILKRLYDNPSATGYMPYRHPGKQVAMPFPGTITICPDKASLERMVSKRKAMGVPEELLRDGLVIGATYRGSSQSTMTIGECNDMDPDEIHTLDNVEVTVMGMPSGENNIKDMFVDITMGSAQFNGSIDNEYNEQCTIQRP